jgi:hypothetical protein
MIDECMVKNVKGAHRIKSHATYANTGQFISGFKQHIQKICFGHGLYLLIYFGSHTQWAEIDIFACNGCGSHQVL